MELRTSHKIFIASLAFRAVRAARKLAGRPMEGHFRRRGLNWHLDLREVVDFMIFISGSFEASLGRFLRRNVGERDIVLDIGANVGAHTLPLARTLGPEGKVFAIEATEFACSKLRANIELNPSLRATIEVRHCLLGEESLPGTPKGDGPHIHASWPFETTAERHPSHCGVTKSVGDAVRTGLDSLAASEGLRRIDLVKLDVDGNEWKVVSSGMEVFRTHRPILVMELAPGYSEGARIDHLGELHTFLSDLDYRFYDLGGRPLPESTEKLRASVSKGASRNIVALPRDRRRVRFNRNPLPAIRH